MIEYLRLALVIGETLCGSMIFTWICEIKKNKNLCEIKVVRYMCTTGHPVDLQIENARTFIGWVPAEVFGDLYGLLTSGCNKTRGMGEEYMLLKHSFLFGLLSCMPAKW